MNVTVSNTNLHNSISCVLEWTYLVRSCKIKECFLHFGACHFMTLSVDHYSELSPFLLPLLSHMSSINSWFKGNFVKPSMQDVVMWMKGSWHKITVKRIVNGPQAVYTDKKCSFLGGVSCWTWETGANGSTGDGVTRNSDQYSGFGDLWKWSRRRWCDYIWII